MSKALKLTCTLFLVWMAAAENVPIKVNSPCEAENCVCGSELGRTDIKPPTCKRGSFCYQEGPELACGPMAFAGQTGPSGSKFVCIDEHQVTPSYRAICSPGQTCAVREFRGYCGNSKLLPNQECLEEGGCTCGDPGSTDPKPPINCLKNEWCLKVGNQIKCTKDVIRPFQIAPKDTSYCVGTKSEELTVKTCKSGQMCLEKQSVISKDEDISCENPIIMAGQKCQSPVLGVCTCNVDNIQGYAVHGPIKHGSYCQGKGERDYSFSVETELKAQQNCPADSDPKPEQAQNRGSSFHPGYMCLGEVQQNKVYWRVENGNLCPRSEIFKSQIQQITHGSVCSLGKVCECFNLSDGSQGAKKKLAICIGGQTCLAKGTNPSCSFAFIIHNAFCYHEVCGCSDGDSKNHIHYFCKKGEFCRGDGRCLNEIISPGQTVPETDSSKGQVDYLCVATTKNPFHVYAQKAAECLRGQQCLFDQRTRMPVCAKYFSTFSDQKSPIDEFSSFVCEFPGKKISELKEGILCSGSKKEIYCGLRFGQPACAVTSILPRKKFEEKSAACLCFNQDAKDELPVVCEKEEFCFAGFNKSPTCAKDVLLEDGEICKSASGCPCLPDDSDFKTDSTQAVVKCTKGQACLKRFGSPVCAQPFTKNGQSINPSGHQTNSETLGTACAMLNQAEKRIETLQCPPQDGLWPVRGRPSLWTNRR